MNGEGEAPNIVFVVGDTLRARELGLYGYERPTAPNLTSFAEDAVVFDRAYANAPWTLPAHATLFTGELPSEHGCHGGSPSLEADLPLASRLSERGYDTYGISNNIWLSRHFGFDDGFDEFYQNWKLFQDAEELAHLLKPGVESGPRAMFNQLLSRNVVKNVLNGMYGKYLYRRNDSGGRKTTKKVTSIIDSADSPFFLFCNYMEPHSKYRRNEFTEAFLPESADPRSLERYEELSQRSPEFHFDRLDVSAQDFAILQGLYDGEIRYFDRELGAIFRSLRSSGRLANTMVVVLGDHGENIGDHGLMEHKFSVHDSVLHVPLVIKYPDESGRSGRESTPVDFRDVFSEILAVSCGQGPELPGTERSAPIVSEYLSTEYVEESNDPSFPFEGSRYDRRLAAVITASHKYITDDGSTEELYRYTGSGVDMSKTVESDATTEAHLSRFAPDFESVNGDGAEISESVERHLEELGYM